MPDSTTLAREIHAKTVTGMFIDKECIIDKFNMALNVDVDQIPEQKQKLCPTCTFVSLFG